MSTTATATTTMSTTASSTSMSLTITRRLRSIRSRLSLRNSRKPSIDTKRISKPLLHLRISEEEPTKPPRATPSPPSAVREIAIKPASKKTTRPISEGWLEGPIINPTYTPTPPPRPISEQTSYQLDISVLPIELHADILDALDHWTHILVASQVCHQWRRLLQPKLDIKKLYQPVYRVPYAIAPPHPRFYARAQIDFYDDTLNGGPPIPPGSTLDHHRHLLFQGCSIAYREVNGRPEVKIHPSKKLGFYDPSSRSFYPTSGQQLPEFYNFGYLSILSQPIIKNINHTPSPERQSHRGGKPIFDVLFQKGCCDSYIHTCIDASEESGYMTLGAVLKEILARLLECFEFKCGRCAMAGEREDTKYLVGAFNDFARCCREYGVVVRENEEKRDMGVMFLNVCPAESW